MYMFRNIIQGSATQEIYPAGENLIKGQVVVKNLATKKAEKADGIGEGLYFVDKDYVPTGAEAGTEVSDYASEAQEVKANEMCILKHLVSGTWGTDQVEATGLAEGDYLVAKDGKLAKAASGKVSTLRYVGSIMDPGKNKIYAVEVVPVHTVA